MKILLQNNCVVKGCAGAKPGDVIEVDQDTANTLICHGLGKPAPESGKVVARAPEVENRDPVIETLPARPSKRKRTK